MSMNEAEASKLRLFKLALISGGYQPVNTAMELLGVQAR